MADSVVVAGVIVILLVTRKIGGGSARFFLRQQIAIGKEEGFVEEIMNGQKVVKVFCHEEETKADFDRINENLLRRPERPTLRQHPDAHLKQHRKRALRGGGAGGRILLVSRVPNVSISGIPIGISIVVPFLNMTKQFVGNISQVSNQINPVVMGLAGAARIFELMDELPRRTRLCDLSPRQRRNGQIVECAERTGMWAWKHPHQADGTVTYTKLEGDVRLFDVDFGYVENRPCSTASAFTRSRARRWPLWAPPAREKPPSPTF